MPRKKSVENPEVVNEPVVNEASSNGNEFVEVELKVKSNMALYLGNKRITFNDGKATVHPDMVDTLKEMNLID